MLNQNINRTTQYLNNTAANNNWQTGINNKVQEDLTRANQFFVSGLEKKPSFFQNMGGRSKNLMNNINGGLNTAGNFLENGLQGNPASTAIGLGGAAIDTGLGAMGLKQADASRLNTGDKILGGAAKIAGFIPGPVGTIANLGLNALDKVNKWGGETSNRMGTDQTMDMAGGYSFEESAQAGTKGTLFGRLFTKKNKRINQRTNYADSQNLKSNYATTQGRMDNTLGINSAQHVDSLNRTNLYGGNSTRALLAKLGTKIPPHELTRIANSIKIEVTISQGSAEEIHEAKTTEAAVMVPEDKNVIPEGAFHSRLNNLPEDIADQVTNKGIPVVTDDGKKLTQHAEIERQEIIFHKGATDILEKLFEEYEKATGKEKDAIAIKCGKYLTSQILENTEDNANLIETV